MAAPARRQVWVWLGLGVLMVAVLGFAVPSALRGVLGLAGDVEAQGRFAGTATSNVAIFVHMIAGGLVTVLAVLQWAAPVRRRLPRVHRISGRVLAPLALVTACGGLVYIALRGTVGGAWMSAGFGLYGLLMLVAAVQTVRFAVARDFVRHPQWGLRMVVLALGSWIYRVHYGLWFAVTCNISDTICGIGVGPEFTGLFDRVQVFAFYVPYLLWAEIHIRRKG